MKHLRATVAASVIMLTGFPAAAHAQLIGGAIAAGLAKMTVGQIFDRVNQTVNTVNNDGNGAILHAADQANLLEQNASLVVGGDLTQTFDQLDSNEQTLIVEMEKWRQLAAGAIPAAYNMIDTVNLDTAYNLQALPFTHEPAFFVQSVKGIAVTPKADDYKVTLNALNVGQINGEPADISVAINGKQIDIAPSDQTQLNRAVITIPKAAIAPLFQQSTLASMPLVISVTIHRSEFFNLYHSSKTYTVPVTLILYPALAGTGNLTISYPAFSWVPVGWQDGDIGVPTDDEDGKCDHFETGCGYRHDVQIDVPNSGKPEPIEGDERVDNDPSHPLGVDCVNREAWCPDTFILQAAISNNGARGTVDFVTTSKPVTIKARGFVEQYDRNAVDGISTFPVSLYFNQMTTVAINPANTSEMILTYTSFTGNTSTIDLTNPIDPQGLLTVVNLGKPADSPRNILLTATPPLQ